jgi:hypothetical protein
MTSRGNCFWPANAGRTRQCCNLKRGTAFSIGLSPIVGASSGYPGVPLAINLIVGPRDARRRAERSVAAAVKARVSQR